MRLLAAAALVACAVGASTALPAAHAAPPCRAHDLGVRLYLQGATGSLLGGVRVTNRGHTAC